MLVHRARSLVPFLSLVILSAGSVLAQQPTTPPGGPPAAPPMTLTVQGFEDGGLIPVRFTQAAPGAAPGEGTSPAMSWTNAPAGTQSFVV
jgi:phosphatidylethanolamine-binding protein (PEBP) family uncharacterized protein